MAKKKLIYFVPVNVLVADDGVKELLIAIAYYRGEGKNYAGPVRDALQKWTSEFVNALSPADRKRFDDILATVTMTKKLEKAIRQDNLMD